MQKLIFYTLPVLLFIFFTLAGNIIARPVQKKQGISGFIYQVSGNRMPSPNRPPSTPKGLSTTLFIYELTNIKDVSRKGMSPYYYSVSKRLITTVQSDSTGHFLVELPENNYSLFTKINHLFYSNSFDVNNNITPVRVEKEKITSVIIKVETGAVY